ncbi:MAG TPA: hypothetical protein VFU56_01425 [Gaiellaceae bacterium]|nr:hypothetical protein [Gaiellaceae bacterium]
MRKALPLTLLLALLTAVAAGAATAPAVPRHSQLALRHKLPSLAYVPTRVGFGFRYYRWATTTRPALRIWFRDSAKREITFVATFQKGACTAGREKTFQLDGNKVYWSQTANEQQAWRCVRGANGRLVRLTVATPIPTTQFADVGIGRIAASGRRVQ